MRPVPDAMRTSDWPKIPARESPPTQRRRGSDGVGGRTVGSGVGDGSDVGLGATKAAGGGSVLASALSTRAGKSNEGAERGSRPVAWSSAARGWSRRRASLTFWKGRQTLSQKSRFSPYGLLWLSRTSASALKRAARRREIGRA